MSSFLRRVIFASVLLVCGALALSIADGAVGYVTTRGTSMEPGFRGGDLAIISRARQYAPGDVVAYRSALLNTVVMHRIVDKSGERYVFKGDNNSWLDGEQPSGEDLVGKLRLRIPGGGSVLDWVAGHALIVAAVPLLLAAMGSGTARRRRPLFESGGGRGRIPRPPPLQTAYAAHLALRAALLGLAGCLLLSVYAFTQPTHRPTSRTIPYTQVGMFGYSAPTTISAAYPGGAVATGDPLFLRVAQAVTVRFEHRVETQATRSLEANVGLRARVADSRGWQRTIELAAPTSLPDATGAVTSTLDISSLRQLIDEFESTTGLHSPIYTIDLIAEAHLVGRLGDQPVDEVFAPRLSFQLDELELRPAWTGGETNEPDGATRQSTTGSVESETSEPNVLRLPLLKISVDDSRRVALVAAGFSALVSALALALSWRQGSDQARAIAARYGNRIIRVAAVEDDGDHTVIDVSSVGDLARLAREHDRLILHFSDGAADRYSFQIERAEYRYVARLH